jgi:hypothetical protein
MLYEEALTYVNDMFKGVYMSRRKRDLLNFLIYLVNKKYSKKDKIIRQINRDFLNKWKFYADLIAKIIPIRPKVENRDIKELVRKNTEPVPVDTSIADKMIEMHKQNLIIEQQFRELNPHIIEEHYESRVSEDIMLREKEQRQKQRKERIQKNIEQEKAKIAESKLEYKTVVAKYLITTDFMNSVAKIEFSDGVVREINLESLHRLPLGVKHDEIEELMSERFCKYTNHNQEMKFLIRRTIPEALYTGPATMQVKKPKTTVKPEPTVHSLWKIVEKDGMKVKCLDKDMHEYMEKLSYDRLNRNINLYPHHSEGFTIEGNQAIFRMQMKKGMCLMTIPYHEPVVKEKVEKAVNEDFEFVSSGEEALPLYYEKVERKVIEMPKVPINAQKIKEWIEVKRKSQKPLVVKNESICYNKFEVLSQLGFDKVIDSIYNPVEVEGKIVNKKANKSEIKNLQKEANKKKLKSQHKLPVDLEKRISFNNLIMSIFSHKTVNSANCVEKVRTDGYLTKFMLPLNKSRRIKVVNKIKSLLEYKDDSKFNK